MSTQSVETVDVKEMKLVMMEEKGAVMKNVQPQKKDFIALTNG